MKTAAEDGFALSREAIAGQFAVIVQKFDMKLHLFFADERPKMAIFASKQLHCLYDLLIRHKARQLLASAQPSRDENPLCRSRAPEGWNNKQPAASESQPLKKTILSEFFDGRGFRAGVERGE